MRKAVTIFEYRFAKRKGQDKGQQVCTQQSYCTFQSGKKVCLLLWVVKKNEEKKVYE